jgi:AraC family transcriptional regulator of adaptative response / DNA-3-methyladenine glycosylase II
MWRKMVAVELDFDRCYRAVDSRDPRFDGWFVTAVSTTGIYCRPSCPANTPKRENVSFHPTAAAAHRLGFRACRRCRPDAAPGSPEWDTRADVVARAMRLISDGVIDRAGVDGLAGRLGFTPRHLHRILVSELGAGPLAIARARRAQTARTLIETTDLSLTEIAFAAGFGSVRQFNDTVREIYAIAPTSLRAAARRHGAANSGTIAVRLAYRPPLHAGALLDFLAIRAIPGVEVVTDEHYVRAMRLPHGNGTVMLTPMDDYVAATLHLRDLRDLSPAVARCRRLLDLDADPLAIDMVLRDDPALRGLVDAEPGVRVPRAVDGFEVAVRAIAGQQISVPSAITVIGKIVRAAHATGDGDHVNERETRPEDGPDPAGGGRDKRSAAAGRAANGREAIPAELPGDSLTPFPTATAVAGLPDGAFAMPNARRATIRALAEAVASGDLVLDGGADRDATEAALRELPGVGPWTASYVAMRALGDPDIFLAGDLALRRAAARLGLPDQRDQLDKHARRWSPWRSYAVIRMWRQLP